LKHLALINGTIIVVVYFWCKTYFKN